MITYQSKVSCILNVYLATGLNSTSASLCVCVCVRTVYCYSYNVFCMQKAYKQQWRIQRSPVGATDPPFRANFINLTL